ncbi:MAG TPA: pectinesterase family protein [Verrucomicrobiae bacterium]|jgi:pectin methylesterase-like acyl-CoA thioesterase|nr:pectinesterase family protein [Verrucomicrobiae bacterium]
MSNRLTFLEIPPALLVGAVLLGAVAFSPARAGTVVWSGSAGVDTNWSTDANWTGGVAPVAGDDVKFYNNGGAGAASNLTSVADLGFTTAINSLQYGNTNGFHTTYITNGATLNVLGTGSGNVLTVGTGTSVNNSTIVNATVTGAGGTLNVSNSLGFISIFQGLSANGNGTQRGLLDLSGLDTFQASVNALRVGSTAGTPFSGPQNFTGTLFLAKTNLISTSLGSANYSAPGVTLSAGVEVGLDNGNAGGVNFLYLGQSNAFFVDSVAVGKSKTTSTLLFNPAFTNSNPFAYFRGTNGPASRVTHWSIGDMADSGSSTSSCSGTNDFSNGTVDIMVATLSLARDRSGGETGTAASRGTLSFTSGSINASDVMIGNDAFGATGNSNPMVGVVNLNGAGAELIVTNTLTLGFSAGNTTQGKSTFGTLNVNNGTVLANNIAVGAFSLSNVINLNGGALIVTNALATNGAGLRLLTLTNATLGLRLSGSALIAFAQNLTTGGGTNWIQLDSAPVIFPSYAHLQFPLISYTTWNGTNNFALAAIPAWAPGATLVSNGANKSLDLLLPTDPRPVITQQPLTYGGNPGDNVTFSVSIDPGSVTPLSFQWWVTDGVTYTNQISDGTSASGSTLSGATTASLSITGAQPADSGSYFVVVTNQFGVSTSALAPLAISLSCVSPNITGPADTTVVQGADATFLASVTANPAASVWWQRNGVNIDGATTTSLTVHAVDFDADNGAKYSIIASNACGMDTNSAVLTVIVPPSITVPPVSLTVTNSQAASFTVAATGEPAPSFQWLKNGNPISLAANPTAQSATLVIASASPSDDGSYSVQLVNSANTTNSVPVTLSVDSADLRSATFAPASGATGVAYDSPLYLTFNATPTVRAAGQIRIYNTTNPGAPVDTLDLSQGIAQTRTVGGETFESYNVIVTGATAAIYPHAGVMTSNQTYYVTIDDGVFADASGAFFSGITDPSVWQFTTKATGPAIPVSLVVAQDNSGDFATVQGAIDSLPANNTTPTLITVQNGTYTEIVNFNKKNNVTLRGQSRDGTIIGYANNVSFTPGGSTHFRMAFKVNANDISLDNLTVTNMTPKGGGQAEALMLESNVKRFILNNCKVASYQDTILANGQAGAQAYFYNSLVQGDVDFIWGGGDCFFTNCEIRMLNPNAQIFQPRTDFGPTGNWPGAPGSGVNVSNGFSLVNCRLTGASATVINCALDRSLNITNGLVALIDCQVDTNVYSRGFSAAASDYAISLFWEYNNSNIDLTGPAAFGGVVLPDNDPRLLAAQSATAWLYGWQPQLAPNIIAQPVGVSVGAGQSAALSVGATGIPDPSYQWLKNGQPIAGANAATFVIPSAFASDAATYSVAVSNVAGVVVSSGAAVSVGNTAPTVTPIADQIVNVGAMVTASAAANDPDVPPQSLTYSLLSGPSDATLDTNSGSFSWRPTLPAAGTSNFVAIVVTDNGNPPMSATNTFSIVVNPSVGPTLGAATLSGGQFSLSISGQVGPDYALQATTNLDDIQWVTIMTTNSPASPFTLIDTNAGADSSRFYRIVVGPPFPH